MPLEIKDQIGQEIKLHDINNDGLLLIEIEDRYKNINRSDAEQIIYRNSSILTTILCGLKDIN